MVSTFADRARLEARFATALLRGRISLLIAQASASSMASSPRVLINSLPKSGTHLLIKLLESLPGLHRVPFQVAPKALPKFRPREGEPVVPVGVGSPVDFSCHRLERALALLPAGTFCTAHVPYSHLLGEVLGSLGMKMVVIIRDPRDVAVSDARFLADREGHPLYSHFGSASLEERILWSICGVGSQAGQPRLQSLRERLKRILLWADHPNVYLTRFESLVGDAGGGSHTAQLHEIRSIARHLQVRCSEEKLTSVAQQLFGGTGTFREGQIGGWRTVFTPALVDTAKPLLTDMLVELGYEQQTDWALQ